MFDKGIFIILIFSVLSCIYLTKYGFPHFMSEDEDPREDRLKKIESDILKIFSKIAGNVAEKNDEGEKKDKKNKDEDKKDDDKEDKDEDKKDDEKENKDDRKKNEDESVEGSLKESTDSGKTQKKSNTSQKEKRKSDNSEKDKAKMKIDGRDFKI